MTLAASALTQEGFFWHLGDAASKAPHDLVIEDYEVYIVVSTNGDMIQTAMQLSTIMDDAGLIATHVEINRSLKGAEWGVQIDMPGDSCLGLACSMNPGC